MRGNEKLKCHVRLESFPQAILSGPAHIRPSYRSTAVCVVTNRPTRKDNSTFTNSALEGIRVHLHSKHKDLETQTKYASVNWSRGVLCFFTGCLSSPFSLICVIAQMNQCHRCWAHLLSTLVPQATALMDTNYKISAPWGDIAQELPHSPEGVWSGQCVCVCMSVVKERLCIFLCITYDPVSIV